MHTQRRNYRKHRNSQRLHIVLTTISLRFHNDFPITCTTTSQRYHINFTSISHRSHIVFTTISHHLQNDFTSQSQRLPNDITSTSHRSHINSTMISHRFHNDFISDPQLFHINFTTGTAHRAPAGHQPGTGHPNPRIPEAGKRTTHGPRRFLKDVLCVLLGFGSHGFYCSPRRLLL